MDFTKGAAADYIKQPLAPKYEHLEHRKLGGIPGADYQCPL